MNTEMVTTTEPGKPDSVILPTPEETERLVLLADINTKLEIVKPFLALPVATPEDFVRISGAFNDVVEFQDRWEALVAPWKLNLHAIYKVASNFYNAGAEALQDFRKKSQAMIIAWEDKAKAEGEKHRQKLQAQIDTEAALADRRIAEQSDEQILEAAYAAEKAGNPQLANEILTQEAAPAMPAFRGIVMAPESPRCEGTNRRVTWKARLVQDEKAVLPATPTSGAMEMLVLAVAADLAKPEAERRGLICLLELNESALNNLGKTMKSQLNIPGCVAYPDQGLTKTRK